MVLVEKITETNPVWCVYHHIRGPLFPSDGTSRWLSQQKWGVNSILVYFWASVADGGPKVNQYWINASFLLDLFSVSFPAFEMTIWFGQTPCVTMRDKNTRTSGNLHLVAWSLNECIMRTRNYFLNTFTRAFIQWQIYQRWHDGALTYDRFIIIIIIYDHLSRELI